MFLKKIFLIALFAPAIVSFAKPIKVGIIAGPSVEVLNIAKKYAKEKYNLDIEPTVFTDYVMPNEAVDSADIDMNIFQTVSYLNQSISKRHYNIVSIGNTFIYPMGIYSKKINKISQLKEKSIIAIPNDASNEGRALLLLSKNGLLKLKPNVGEFGLVSDIIENPKKLKIVTMNGSQLARVVPDVDAVVLNNDFVEHAGFKPTEALVQENPLTAQPYINIIVVNTKNADRKEFKQIVEVMHSNEVLQKTMQLYPSAVRAWQ